MSQAPGASTWSIYKKQQVKRPKNEIRTVRDEGHQRVIAVAAAEEQRQNKNQTHQTTKQNSIGKGTYNGGTQHEPEHTRQIHVPAAERFLLIVRLAGGLHSARPVACNQRPKLIE